MNYKQKYEQLTKFIKDLYPHMSDYCKEKTEGILPELKESEDEKSKKWILDYLYDGLRKSDEQFKDHFKAAIAWLEKAVTPTPQDWNDYKDKPVELWNNYVQGLANGIERGKNAVRNCPSSYGLEKQGEQKPTWSEEDERERRRVVGLLEGWLSTFKETCYAEDCQCGIIWLKSLKQRIKGE